MCPKEANLKKKQEVFVYDAKQFLIPNDFPLQLSCLQSFMVCMALFALRLNIQRANNYFNNIDLNMKDLRPTFVLLQKI